MKRCVYAIIVLAFLLPVSALSAYDQMWGGRLGVGLELPEIYGSTIAVSNQNSLGAWYRGTWSPMANIDIDAGLGADFDFMFGVTNTQSFSWHGLGYDVYPELDRLNFNGHSGILGYSAGRMLTGDPAGLILNAPFDGVDVSLDIGRHVFGAGFGYTGLTFRQSSQYSLTNLDSSDKQLSADRLMEYLSWEMPAANEWLNVAAYIIAVQDLSADDDLTEYSTEKFHPMYLEVMIRGFLGESFLYNVALAGQYGTYGSSTVLAGIGQLGFSWLPGGPSRLGAEIQVSSGDASADRESYLLGGTVASDLHTYLPLSVVSSRGYVIEFQPGNLASLGLFYSRKPRETFSWEIRTTSFLRSAEGPVSASVVPQTSDSGRFLGQELLFSWFWRPKSDFGWDLKAGLMYTGEPVQLDSYLQEFYLDKVPLMMRIGFDWSWSF